MTDEIDTAEDATDSEVARYEKAFRETRRVIDECIRALMIMKRDETDTDRRDQIAAKIFDLETERSDLIDANIAFHTRNATMVPPPAALGAEIVKLSKQAVELTVERATAAAVLKLATSALNKFAEIQKLEDA